MVDEDLQEIWRDVKAKPLPVVYQGKRYETGKCVVSVTRNHKTSHLKQCKGVLNHSPSGFEWGYPGSGPAQLALSILVDALRDKERAIKLHQKFKGAVIVGLPQKGWTLTHNQVMTVVARLEGPGKGGDRGG